MFTAQPMQTVSLCSLVAFLFEVATELQKATETYFSDFFEAPPRKKKRRDDDAFFATMLQGSRETGKAWTN